MYPPSYEAVTENALKCKHCGKSGRMTYSKAEKEQIVCGVPLGASPAEWHCNYCGCNQEA